MSVPLNILLINSSATYKPMNAHKGSEATIITTVELLKEFVPNAQITTMIHCTDSLCNNLKLRKAFDCLSHSFTGFKFYKIIKSLLEFILCCIYFITRKSMKINTLMSTNRLREYRKTDVIIHIGADMYSDEYNLYQLLDQSQDIMYTFLIGTPFVMWAEGPGPFKTWLGRIISKITLNKAILITLREAASKTHLGSIGVDNPNIYVTADPVILLPSASQKRVDEILKKYNIDLNKPICVVVPSDDCIK